VKKLMTGVAVAAAIASGVALAAPANAAQGGFDPNGKPHAWIKVPYREMNVRPNSHGGWDAR
jgi:hypothetical protein